MIKQINKWKRQEKNSKFIPDTVQIIIFPKNSKKYYFLVKRSDVTDRQCAWSGVDWIKLMETLVKSNGSQ